MSDGSKWLATSNILWRVGSSRAACPLTNWLCVLGGIPGEATEPITDGEVEHPGMRGRSDGVVRVGEDAGWAFAAEYWDSTGADRLEEIASGRLDAVHYLPMGARPPARFHYAKNGVLTCGFGIGEEHRRWGVELACRPRRGPLARLCRPRRPYLAHRAGARRPADQGMGCRSRSHPERRRRSRPFARS